MNISQTKDYELIAKLNKPVHDLHYSLYPEIFNAYYFETMKEIFKEKVDNEHAIFLLLEDEGEGEAIGYAWIDIQDRPANLIQKAHRSIYIHQISLNETKRNKGYGTRLMEHIYAIAEENGINLIELDYWADNFKAAAFYKKQGFVNQRQFVYKQL